MDKFLNKNSIRIKMLLPCRLWSRRKKIVSGVAFFVLISLWIIPTVVKATMSGATYQIPWDVFSEGGGEDQAGSVYSLQNTQGELSGGEVGGSVYGMRAGYRQSEEVFLESSISTNLCNLGILDSQTVAGCRITITTSTNASGGYVTMVSSLGLQNSVGHEIDAVLDGSITAGSEEYGIATEDVDADISQYTGGDVTDQNCRLGLDGPLGSFDGLSVMPQSVVTSMLGGEETFDICVATAIATTSVSGGYGDTLTFITTGTF